MKKFISIPLLAMVLSTAAFADGIEDGLREDAD